MFFSKTIARRLPVALCHLGLIVFLFSAAAFGQTSIAVNGSQSGLAFGGIGAISGGGGNSRLLFDYPSVQQSEILDYLFKPGTGASLQILKVEIGGGADSTDGSESSHEPVQGQIDCNTGYEWSLMEQAQARNPNIKLYGLAWTAPGWLGGWYNTNSINYVVDWLKCAQSHNLNISYLGGLNEDGIGTASWWEQLRSTLNSDGFSSVQLVGGDQANWSIADSLVSNSSWASVMSVVGAHYPCSGSDGGNADTCSTTANALATGKPLWQSEGGSMDFNNGAPNVIRAIVRGYTDASMTAYINWPLI
ncbi:MAG: galactosylceramidase, partial [Bryobacteraceae bacterium]